MAAARVYQRRWLLVRLPIALVALALMVWLWVAVLPMPPTHLTMSAGAPDGIYHANGARYARALAARGVQLDVIDSAGAVQNLQRLRDEAGPPAQLAFVQGGVVVPESDAASRPRLLTIARIDVEPRWIFSRQAGMDSLQQLQGLRVSLGARGSGGRQLARALLRQVRLGADDVVESPLVGLAAVRALREGQLDAMLLVSAPGAPAVRALLQAPGIHLVQLSRSAAIIELLPHLQLRLLPQGALDPAARLPAHDTTLLVTTASLVARADLAPALQRLAAATARDMHEAPGLFHRAGEFPSLKRVEFPASVEARRTLAEGLPWLEQQLPFWWAQVAIRLLVICVPVLLFAWALARLVPAWLHWLVETRLVRWYGELKYIEHDLARQPDHGLDAARHLRALRGLEQQMVAFVPPDDLMPRWFTLRKHVHFVRQRLFKGHGR